MFFKKEKEKKMNVPDLWNFMTSGTTSRKRTHKIDKF